MNADILVPYCEPLYVIDACKILYAHPFRLWQDNMIRL